MTEKRILLVEDEAITRDLLEDVLLAEGYRLDAASTVVEAITCLGRKTYALVIADWRLPDGDGLLVADMASEQGAKTFVMSGYLLQIPSWRAEHESLMKPLRPSEIVQAVERAIGRAGAD
jgi:DNA-binding response OmpR family regulator